MACMRKIAFIGAGSTVFTRNLIGDVLSLPELADTTTFALMDIDAERLRTSETVARGLVATHGARAGVEESSEHFAEYVPWFIKSARPDLIDRFGIPLDEYLRRCERQIAEWDDMRARIARDGAAALEAQRSVEYGAHIIRACETGEPFAFNGNVPNRHVGGRLIDNLADDCCVEVPCVAGRGRRRAAAGLAPSRATSPR